MVKEALCMHVGVVDKKAQNAIIDKAKN